MSYFDYLKNDVYDIHNKIITMKNNVKSDYSLYIHNFKNPVYLIKLDLPDILIGYTLSLTGNYNILIDITKSLIELFKNNNIYMPNLKKIQFYSDIASINIPKINITYTLKNIKKTSSILGNGTSLDYIKYIESVHILSNEIINNTNFESIYSDKKNNKYVYKTKLDNFKYINTNFIGSIYLYLNKYISKRDLLFHVNYNSKVFS